MSKPQVRSIVWSVVFFVLALCSHGQMTENVLDLPLPITDWPGDGPAKLEGTFKCSQDYRFNPYGGGPENELVFQGQNFSMESHFDSWMWRGEGRHVKKLEPRRTGTYEVANNLVVLNFRDVPLVQKFLWRKSPGYESLSQVDDNHWLFFRKLLCLRTTPQ
jgi:hypothetical protein